MSTYFNVLRRACKAIRTRFAAHITPEQLRDCSLLHTMIGTLESRLQGLISECFAANRTFTSAEAIQCVGRADDDLCPLVEPYLRGAARVGAIRGSSSEGWSVLDTSKLYGTDVTRECQELRQLPLAA
jgi:hypothetical protein